MRGWVLVWVGVGLVCAGRGHAQSVIDGAPPRAEVGGMQLSKLDASAADIKGDASGLVLRPAPDLEALAERVARVLALRTGRSVRVGQAPPLGMLEAVPAGQLAMAREGQSIQLVWVGAEGRTHRSAIPLPEGGEYPEARAVALAVEALHDLVQDGDPVPGPVAEPPAVAPGEAGGAAAEPWAEDGWRPRGAREPADTGTELAGDAGGLERVTLGFVEPLMYLRAFTGISPLDRAPTAGVGTGVGLCLKLHCFVLGGELPLLPAEAQDAVRVRYRYASFHARFYLRPFVLGAFKPAASLGLVTHVGTAREMPEAPESPARTETNVGARGSMELALELVASVELMVEAGLDRAIDRARHVPSGTWLEDTWSPWGLAALRFNP